MAKDYSDVWGCSINWKKVFFNLMDKWWEQKHIQLIVSRGSGRYNEAKLTQSLYDFLSRRLKKEFEVLNMRPRENSTIPDIRLRTQSDLFGCLYEDAIEVKKGLSSTNEENRLIGQVSKYCKKYSHCFVVICGGEIKSGLVDEVKRHLSEEQRKKTAIWTPFKELRF